MENVALRELQANCQCIFGTAMVITVPFCLVTDGFYKPLVAPFPRILIPLALPPCNGTYQ